MKTLVGLWMVAAVITLGSACGGGGPSDGTLLVDLSPDDASSVCSDLIADFPARTIECDSTEVTVGFASVSGCISTLPDATNAPACTATVGDAEDCANAFDAETDEDVCNNMIPTECAPLFTSSCAVASS